MGKILELAQVAPAISAVVHELQKERGMSAGFIAGKGAKFAQGLPAQRKLTDDKRAALAETLKSFDAASFGTGLVSKIDASRQALAALGDMRAQISGGAIGAPEMAAYFTSTIAKLLRIVEEMTVLGSDVDVTNAITAYTAFLQGKERAGIERAMGAVGFGAGEFTPATHLKFVQLIAMQEIFLTRFDIYASAEQKAFLQSVLVGAAVDEVDRLRQIAIASPLTGSLGGIEGAYWYSAATEKINLLKTVEDKVASDLQAMAAAIESSAFAVFLILVGATFILLLVTAAMVFTVATGITRPIVGMTGAMRSLSEGNMAVDIPGADSSGEVGEMAAAMQIFKDNMIKAEKLAAERKLAEDALRDSEQRQRLISDNVPAFIGYVDSDGKYRFANKFYQRALNRPLDQIVGHHVSDVIGHENYTANSESYRRVFSGETFTSHVKVISNDGRSMHVLAHYMPDRAPSGTVRGYYIMAQDITELKQREEALRESEERFRAIFEDAAFGIATADVDGRMVNCNPALCKMLGYDFGELDGKPWSEFTHPDDIAENAELSERLGQGEIKSFRMEKRYIRKDGSLLWAYLTVSSAGDDIERSRFRVAMIEDITERKVIEAALRKTQKMDAVGELAGGIAHDFNNILGIVMGNLEILRSMIAENPKAVRRIDTALKNVKRGARLTKLLLGFSSRATGDSEIVSVNEIVADSGEFVRRSLTKMIAVEFRLAEGLWPVDVDPGELGDSILNLAVNARDAMPDGGDLIIETANKEVDENDAGRDPGLTPGEYVLLSVRDTGEGMSRETIEKIYDPFFSTKGRDKGSGLGLAMVYGFVKRSGGHISVHSEPGGGSEFHIFLPRSLEKSGAAKSPDDAAKELPGGSETILVVDDERAMLEISIDHLTELEYQTVGAEDGRQALQLLKQNGGIDLLFSDVIMPGGMDGFELARQARDIHPGLGILLTSGFAETDGKADSQNDPLVTELRSKILEKPYNKKELAEKVRQTLDESG
ncbi:MAG: nitrate- and nitrite sensing domain-containing protein [Alphaproteobacteria bacterium]|jgi:PAS domain S-box-containing protein|nr:nitrate- and nitrite sensing domain-containing protein [Alphaproteobacteria bacterium]